MVNTGTLRQKRYFDQEYFERLIISFFFTLTSRLSLVYGQRRITSLEATLDQKKNANALIEDEINHMVDEEYVRKTAIMKLSMYVPSEKDIIYFDKSNNSYVRHYDNVK